MLEYRNPTVHTVQNRGATDVGDKLRHQKGIVHH